VYARFGREATVSHLQAEIENAFDPPTPIGSFFFCNRARPWSPYKLLGSLPKVFSPYLDHDLFDFLVSSL
jgi:asparagine synthase (glutamine-hydrolysing)